LLKEQHRFFQSVLVVADLCVVTAACVAAYWVRFDWLGEMLPVDDNPRYRTHALPVEMAAPLMFMAMLWAGLYMPRRDRRFHDEAAAIIRAVAIGTGMTIIVLSLFRNILFDGRHYSGWQLIVYAGLCTMLLCIWRYCFRIGLRVLRSSGWNIRHVAILGTGRLGQSVCATFRDNSWTGISPAFFISHHPVPERDELMGLEVRGGTSHLEELLGRYDVSGVTIALPGRMAADLPDLLMRLERFPCEVRVVPDVNPKYMPLNLAFNELDGMPILSVRQSPMATGWGKILKRALDIVGALTALTIFAVPMIVIAILVRRSGPGPVIFQQQRMSVHGQRFEIFKFRTMVQVDAEKQALRDSGRVTSDASITGIGRLLRKTSLDELPQLFNVLLGDMSLVGPRPERPKVIEHIWHDRRGYMLRHHVKAGMTGWAQVNGLRGDKTSVRKRIQYDLFYIRNWSILFDLRILWMTVYKGFGHPNAG